MTRITEGGLVFKGGTALRKFRAGNAGRFSTDLDFSAPDEEVALAALQALDVRGQRLHFRN
ncbi:nucleotidyl transferase AbiEii/AbiGii toxin family protein [Mycobacterium simulans]|uniref:nucleotidyl transferase AbiEii/AbiGii toxin family protein n=1 Tax=Mycobacterium simulans TaxID=627089 RepID=UPI001640F399|nr:nucleotidyl transferase AbiEii/AbiGii toxin family protein [Mycobacterium simulans]